MTDQTSAPKQAHKAPYEKPGLRIFGNMSELTQAVGVHANPDGGPAGANKTGL